MNVKDSIGTIKGIGPKKEQVFNENGICTIEDLIFLFPREYQDRRRVNRIKDLSPGKESLICAKILSVKSAPNYYRRNSPLSLIVGDESGEVEIVFFNGKFIAKLFNINEEYTFYGRISQNFGRFQMIHPEFSRAGSKDDIRGIIPIYPKIPGVSQKEIRKHQRELMDLYDEVEEWIPKEIVDKYRLASIPYALKNIHFPEDGKKFLAAKFRMIFSELLVMEVGIIYSRIGEKSVGSAVRISCEKGDEFKNNLPFTLTRDQEMSWKSIKNDLESKRRMNRLLQGDVGSGKTVIAELAMISTCNSGYQSVIMAPTELLAKQHFETFKKDYKHYNVEPKLLISSMDREEKRETIKELESGECKILIATHAVIQDNVKFKNLGLVITDEQHRFGVNQRRKLSEKGEGVNVLVMTATPIPRTLAVILFGDLDISQIRTMPEGRKPINTKVFTGDERHEAYGFAEEKIKEGRQIYVVAPLIEDSESIDAESALGLYDELNEKFNSYRVGLVHGALKQSEKDEIMEDFSQGKIDILVSTVVIEVGINIPNATVMIIENAERFGLAQLHQLRGRVGRGSIESYCFLISHTPNEISEKRLEVMVKTGDGFEIAEEDMALRGPGEIFGLRQHGSMQPMISDLVKHIDVLEQAQSCAKEILDLDPGLNRDKNMGIKRRVKKMFGDEILMQL